MNTKSVMRPIRLFLICLAVIVGAGCESFRWGEYPYQDLVQQQQEQCATNNLMFKPGTIFYMSH